MLKILKAAVIAGLVLGAALLALGVLARWYPALDIINNGLPVLAVGGTALLALAFAVRNRTLITGTAAFMAVTFALLLSGLSGAAPQAPDGAARFMRVATFNLWGRNDHQLNQVAAFLAETKADAVVLEEVRGASQRLPREPCRSVSLPRRRQRARYSVEAPDCGRWPCRPRRPAVLDVAHHSLGAARRGRHASRACRRSSGTALLCGFATGRHRCSDHLRAGEDRAFDRGGRFQHGPWTVKLKTFTKATGLGRFNTFYPTWPMRWKSVPLLPLVPIDNVFATDHFTKIDARVGPRLDSDHRPVIADIALIE